MRKFICAIVFLLLIVTCQKVSVDPLPFPIDTTGTNNNASDTNTSLIGKWQLLSYQADGGSGDVSWHPVDATTYGYIIFTSDSLISQLSFGRDTVLYKITGPGKLYLYRGVDSFPMVYHSSATLLYFTSPNCSEACGQRFVPVK